MDPIDEEETSGRMRLILPFIATRRIVMRIIKRMIPERRRALEIENDCIGAYRDKHGKEPAGSSDHDYPGHRWREDKSWGCRLLIKLVHINLE
ncbi:MAG: hypothetical protein ACJA0J_002484 [Bdellovibrionota bacterium]